EFLHDKPVSLIWGVGQATRSALAASGIRNFADLLRWEHEELIARFGAMGDRLWHLARGQDHRRVSAHEPVKSISNETTFHEDISDRDILEGHVWRLSEKVADRAKAKALAGRVVTLKLKRSDHSLLTRRVSLREPTQMADTIFRTARDLLLNVPGKEAFRLLGIGLSQLCSDGQADMSGDLLDPDAAKRTKTERATDAIRDRFGTDAIVKGRALR
ncbi:MAG: DNA polymerase IV, partial [Pseudomonadota bacterium]